MECQESITPIDESQFDTCWHEEGEDVDKIAEKLTKMIKPMG